MQTILEKLERTRAKAEWDGPDELNVDFFVGDKDVGLILFERLPPRKVACKKDVETLKSAGHIAKDVWAVVASGVNESMKGRGYGGTMYRAGIKAIVAKHSPVYIAAGECEVAGRTSDEAKRVWHPWPANTRTAGECCS